MFFSIEQDPIKTIKCTAVSPRAGVAKFEIQQLEIKV